MQDSAKNEVLDGRGWLVLINVSQIADRRLVSAVIGLHKAQAIFTSFPEPFPISKPIALSSSSLQFPPSGARWVMPWFDFLLSAFSRDILELPGGW
jgi:hypothetical protein